MKTNFKSIGPVELENSDLGEALIFWAKKNKDNAKEFIKIITAYLEEDMGMNLIGPIQRENDFSKIVANVEVLQNNSEVKLIGSPVKEERTTDKKSNAGFIRTNRGFYDMVGDIIIDYRNKGKDSIKFEELANELTFEFGHAIELWRVKQYLAPSQIARYKKKLPAGTKRTPDDDGLIVPKGKA